MIKLRRSTPEHFSLSQQWMSFSADHGHKQMAQCGYKQHLNRIVPEHEEIQDKNQEVNQESFLSFSFFWPHYVVWLVGSQFPTVLAAQLCLTLCDPMDCSSPSSSVHEILHARILEWVAMPFSRGSSQPRDQTQVSHIVGRFFTV